MSAAEGTSHYSIFGSAAFGAAVTADSSATVDAHASHLSELLLACGIAAPADNAEKPTATAAADKPSAEHEEPAATTDAAPLPTSHQLSADAAPFKVPSGGDDAAGAAASSEATQAPLTPTDASQHAATTAASSAAANTTITSAATHGGPQRTNVYIAWLPRTFEERDLVNLVSQYGEIASVRLVQDASRSYAFVLYASREAAEHALAGLNATRVNGRRLQARISNAHDGNRQPGAPSDRAGAPGNPAGPRAARGGAGMAGGMMAAHHHGGAMGLMGAMGPSFAPLAAALAPPHSSSLGGASAPLLMQQQQAFMPVQLAGGNGQIVYLPVGGGAPQQLQQQQQPSQQQPLMQQQQYVLMPIQPQQQQPQQQQQGFSFAPMSSQPQGAPAAPMWMQLPANQQLQQPQVRAPLLF